jgi:glutamate dehydrogenase (NAD(P)+)
LIALFFCEEKLQLKTNYNYNKNVFNVKLQASSVPFFMEDEKIEDSLDHKAKKQLYKAAKETDLDPNLLKILEQKVIEVIHGILANAGEVVVSHLEWVQGMSGLFLEENQVNGELERKMIKAFKEVWEKSVQKTVTLHCAAYLVALETIPGVYRLRGIFP